MIKKILLTSFLIFIISCDKERESVSFHENGNMKHEKETEPYEKRDRKVNSFSSDSSIGLEMEKDKNVKKSENTISKGQLIGSWIDKSAYNLGSVNIILINNNKVLIKNKGLLGSKEIIETNGIIEPAFNEISTIKWQKITYKNDHGEYYIIDHNGNLKLYDDMGLITPFIKK